MTIRGPGQPPVIRPGAGAPGGAAPAMPSPADALMRLGLMKGGMDAGAVMNALLSFLVLQGFVPKADGAKAGGAPLDDAAKLAEALKQLQAKEGLPQTGRLDEKTMKALEKHKPATTAGERATERQAATMERQTASRAANSFREANLASWIKNKTEPPPMAKPPSIQTQTPNAPPPQQQTAQMRPETTAQQQIQQQQPDTRVQQQQREAVTEQKAQADGRATRESGDGKPPPTAAKGSQGAQGQEGAGKPSQEKQGLGTGKQEDQVGGRSNDDEGLARGDADQLTAFEDGRGNQATGDEDEEDERRGAALVDDGSGADEGAYKIPSLREQIEEALAKLSVEENTDPNRPTTYKGEFLLYKPGTYQSRTQAPQVLNMKVVKATAYDPVWEKVVEQINARLGAFEAAAEKLDISEIQTALSIARVRAW